MRLVLVCVVLSLSVSCASTGIGRPQPGPGDQPKGEDAIGFEVFASFKRVEKVNPILALEPPLWAAATHAIVVDNTVHYIWSKRDHGRRLAADARHGSGGRPHRHRAGRPQPHPRTLGEGFR